MEERDEDRENGKRNLMKRMGERVEREKVDEREWKREKRVGWDRWWERKLMR